MPQDLADGDGVARDDAIVAGIACRLVDHHAGRDRMVIAAGEQGGAGRGTERRGVEPGVAQPVGSDTVQRRRRNHAAESRGSAETHVVGHDEQNVGRAFGRSDKLRPPGLRLEGVGVDLAAKGLRRGRQVSAVDGGGRAGRSRRAGGLLRGRGAERHDRREANAAENSGDAPTPLRRRRFRIFPHFALLGLKPPDPPRTMQGPWRIRAGASSHPSRVVYFLIVSARSTSARTIAAGAASVIDSACRNLTNWDIPGRSWGRGPRRPRMVTEAWTPSLEASAATQPSRFGTSPRFQRCSWSSAPIRGKYCVGAASTRTCFPTPKRNAVRGARPAPLGMRAGDRPRGFRALRRGEDEGEFARSDRSRIDQLPDRARRAQGRRRHAEDQRHGPQDPSWTSPGTKLRSVTRSLRPRSRASIRSSTGRSRSPST